MARIEKYPDEEEFYAHFIRVSGKRGVVLVFYDSYPHADNVAKEIAAILDAKDKP